MDDYSFWNQFDGRSDFKINTLLSKKCIALSINSQAECVKGRLLFSLCNTGAPARTKTSEHLYCCHGNTATIADISSVRATGETFISGVFAADHTLCTFFLISSNACFSTTNRKKKNNAVNAASVRRRVIYSRLFESISTALEHCSLMKLHPPCDKLQD